MHDTDAMPARSGTRSLPSIPLQLPEGGKIHPDQSYLGRPIDREVVARVRSSLDAFTGPRTLEEREKIISERAEEKIRKTAEATAEHWAWVNKVKEEAVPSFKLPEDPRKGMPSQETYIKRRVKKGLRELRDKTSDYKAWVEELRSQQAYRLHEKLEAKKQADEAFSREHASAEHDREKRDAEIQERVRETQRQYWSWLGKMKDEVAKRPNSAPPARPSGVEDPAVLAEKKKKEMTTQLRQLRAEYSAWLDGVKVAKFQLPTTVVDVEEQERRRAGHKQRAKEAVKASSDYYAKVKEMEQKHHARIMKVVKKRLDADKQYNDDHEAATRTLAAKMEAERQKQAEVTAKSRNELKDMYQRVRDKPLFLEVAYNKKAPAG